MYGVNMNHIITLESLESSFSWNIFYLLFHLFSLEIPTYKTREKKNRTKIHLYIIRVINAIKRGEGI